MEQRRARSQVQRFVAMAMALASSSACSLPNQRAMAVPVARATEEGRPLQLLAPVERWSKRDAIVRIVGQGNVTCTGTLIADDRVLTAHHCVAARDRQGRVLTRDMAPEDLQIELGQEDFPWGEVRVRAVIAPQCGYASGEGDLAILVLQRHLIGMPTVGVRIESPPELGEDLHIHGFGRCAPSGDQVTDTGVRNKRDAKGKKRKNDDPTGNLEDAGETVDWIRPGAIHLRSRDADKVNWIGAGQFSALAAICPGDSGGPVYSSKEDLIGVVSASVMNADQATARPSVFTRVDQWGPLFSAAEELSNGASPAELPPYGDCRPARPASRTAH